MQAWPRWACTAMAVVPFLVLAVIIVSLVINMAPVFEKPLYDLNRDGAIDGKDYVGLKGVFSTEISAIYTANLGKFGLIPAMLGTVVIVLVSMCLAVPVALAMAIISTEFTMGVVGRAMRALLGILAGIPPIIYALMGSLMYTLIIVPNFRAEGNVTPPGMDWYSGNPRSTLLGGMMLAMLLVPFLAPLFEDAIRSVPRSFKEASLGLGATRWHTLWKVTLPGAYTGLLSAGSLGVLKAMGDVIIVAILVGFETNIPSPFFDIFQPLAPLTSTGAGLSGGLSQSFQNPMGAAVANFAGLILIAMAVAILLAINFLQNRFRKRFSLDAR